MMTRFLVEVPHDDSKEGCARAIRTFLATGSHFMTNADWGCSDGEHKAWFIVDMDSKEEARFVLPPMYRSVAQITALEKFTQEKIDAIMAQHDG
jgi:hypothetical protein